MKYYEHGVTRRDFKQLVNELTDRGHEVVIYYRSKTSDLSMQAKYVKIKTHAFTTAGHLRSFGRQIRKALKKDPVDCFVTFSRVPGADVYYLGEHSSTDAIRRKYGFWRWFVPGFFSIRALEKQLFSGSKNTKIFALTASQIERLTRNFKMDPDRFIQLPPGIPYAFKRPSEAQREEIRAGVREKLNIKENEMMVLQIGPGFHAKGVDRTLAALAALPEDELANIKLVVGGSGSVSKMDSLARHLRIRSKVYFSGSREKETELLAAADMLVHPARNASTDSVPLEALAFGVPAICSGDYGFCDLITANGGMALPVPFSCRDFSRMLRLIINTPEKLAEMREAALEFDPESLYRRIPFAADMIEGIAGK